MVSPQKPPCPQWISMDFPPGNPGLSLYEVIEPMVAAVNARASAIAGAATSVDLRAGSEEFSQMIGFTLWLCQNGYGKTLFLMVKSTISMAIFHSYVKLPEGNRKDVEKRFWNRILTGF